MYRVLRHVKLIFAVYLVYFMNLIIMDTKIKGSIDLFRLLKESEENKYLKVKPKVIYL